MQIIIFRSNKNKSKSYKINILLFSLFILFSCSLVLLMSTSSLYMYGYKKGYKELYEDRIEDLDYYKKEISRIRDESQIKMDFFSQKLISISSEIDKINSLGNKLSKLAKLDKKKFDFKNPNYIGGTNKVNIEFEYNSNFENYLNNIMVDLDSKHQHLIEAYKIINNLEMKEQFFPSGLPSKKGYISSDYGTRLNPITKKQHFHKGVDIAHRTETDIRSLAAGKVTFSGKKYGYGNLVEISHINGYKTRYAHNNRNLVKVGEHVKKGQTIAKMGSTGHSTGPHVHLEVLKNNKNINPNKFIHYKERFSKN